jgi:hypothetical protein
MASLWLLFFAIPSEIPLSRGTEISPRFYPNVGSVILGLLSLLLFCQELLRNKSNDLGQSLKRWNRVQWQLLGVTAAIVACTWLVPFVGFYIISLLMMVGLYTYLGVRGWARVIAICVGCLVFIYFLFEKGLRVELPRGFFQ